MWHDGLPHPPPSLCQGFLRISKSFRVVPACSTYFVLDIFSALVTLSSVFWRSLCRSLSEVWGMKTTPSISLLSSWITLGVLFLHGFLLTGSLPMVSLCSSSRKILLLYLNHFAEAVILDMCLSLAPTLYSGLLPSSSSHTLLL